MSEIKQSVNNDYQKRTSMKSETQYREYLQNKDFTSYPNNKKLRTKTQTQQTSLKLQQQYDNKTNSQSNDSKVVQKTKEIHFKQRKIQQQTDSGKTQRQKQKLSRNRHNYTSQIQVPYDTQELNKNVSKVLSQIQQIESQFRKKSSQNSLYMKQPTVFTIFNSFSRKQQQLCEYQRSSFFESLMSKIKKPVKYEDKSDEFVQKEKKQLIKLVKNLNKKLNDKLKEVEEEKEQQLRKSTLMAGKFDKRRRVKTQIDDDAQVNEASRKNQRTPSALEFEKSVVQIVEELHINNKLIENMKNQLQFLGKKYEGYQNSLKNYKSIQTSISEVQSMIKQKKQEISKIRKKKFLTQKSIISIQKRNGNIFASNSKDILSTNCSTSTHSSEVIISLRQQYSQHLKKKEKLKDRIEVTKMHLNRIQELKDKHNVNKEHFDQLLQQMKEANQVTLNYAKHAQMSKKSLSLSKHQITLGYKLPHQKESSQQSSLQHIHFIYKARKSKLQILMNTIKRTQESNKRKYYNLLKQYEALIYEQGDDNGDSHLQLQSRTQGQSEQSSRLKNVQVPIIKIFKDHEKMIDQKLENAKSDVQQLEKKILRFNKIGKIIKKVNNNFEQIQKDSYNQQQEFSQSSESLDEEKQNEEYDMEFDSQQDQEDDKQGNDKNGAIESHLPLRRSQNNSNIQSDKKNVSPSKLIKRQNNNNAHVCSNDRNQTSNSQSSFSNVITSQRGKPKSISHSLQRISSPSFQPSAFPLDDSHNSMKQQQTPKLSPQKNNQNSRLKGYLTEISEDYSRSHTTDLTSLNAIDQDSVKYDDRMGSYSRNNRKYIGKFKKQRILEKQRSVSYNLVQVANVQTQNRKQKYMYQKPIIEEQVEGGSSSFDTSMSKVNSRNKRQTIGHQEQGLDSHSPSSHKQPVQISPSIQQGEQDMGQEQYLYSIDQQMQEIKRQLQTQQKEEELKLKYDRILYHAKLFTS